MPSPVDQSNFRLGIVILAHKHPEQLAALLVALRHPRVNVYLHLDAKSAIAPFREALASADLEDVRWLTRRRTAWGTIAIVDAQLDGMARALADGCTYVANISGEDFPIRPINEIVEFFEKNRNRSYVHGFPLPHEGWEFNGRERTDFYTYSVFGRSLTCVPFGEDALLVSRSVIWRAVNLALRLRSALRPKRRFPSYLIPHGGENWMNLNEAAVRYVLEFVRDRPDYRRYHLDTGCSDELFVQSILLGTGFTETHEIVNDALRFLIWGTTDSPHPKTLTMDDLPALTRSSAFFARKISCQDEPELFAELQQRAGSGLTPG